MDIPAEGQKIAILLHKDRPVSPLQEMPHPHMPSIEKVRVSPIYPMHDLQEIPLGGFQDEMIMVVHQDIGMNQDTIAIMVILHEAKELYPVLCIKKDFSPLIPTAGNMIQSPRIFNPKRSSHSLYISYPQRYVKFQGLTPMSPYLPLCSLFTLIGSIELLSLYLLRSFYSHRNGQTLF